MAPTTRSQSKKQIIEKTTIIKPIIYTRVLDKTVSNKKYFVEINGYLFTSENRQILLSIVGFYFGSAAASNKS
jgi:hypothetical protein